MIANVYPESGSELLKGYYNNKIVPDFQNIFREQDGERLTLKQTDEKLRGMSPVMLEELPKEETNGFHIERVKSIYEVSENELLEHTIYCRMIAAKKYNYVVNDPRHKNKNHK